MKSKAPKKVKSGLSRKIAWARGIGEILQQEAGYRLQGVFGSNTGASPLEQKIRQATQVVEHLSKLKGSAMKLGQMLALEAREYFPDEIVIILEKLQSSAEPLDFSTIRAILKDELGEYFDHLSSFSEVPIASASIGQVHKAIYLEQPVAIKVQYPGVGQSIDTDIALLKQILRIFSVFSGRSSIDTDGVVQEIATMFIQETNYKTELEFLEDYRLLSKDISCLVVPRAYSKLCTSRVLTTEFIEGITISHALRENYLRASQKQFYGELFMNLYTHEFCNWGLVQTDPNLGNFLIQPRENKLVALDFGATRRYTRDFRRSYCKLVLAAYENNRKLVLDIAFEMDMIDLREVDAGKEAFLNLVIASMRPFREEVYDFSDGEYAVEMRHLTQCLIKELKFSPPPRELIFLHRKLGGIFQILRRLESKQSLKKYLDIYEHTAKFD